MHQQIHLTFFIVIFVYCSGLELNLKYLQDMPVGFSIANQTNYHKLGSFNSKIYCITIL